MPVDVRVASTITPACAREALFIIAWIEVNVLVVLMWNRKSHGKRTRPTTNQKWGKEKISDNCIMMILPTWHYRGKVFWSDSETREKKKAKKETGGPVWDSGRDGMNVNGKPMCSVVLYLTIWNVPGKFTFSLSDYDVIVCEKYKYMSRRTYQTSNRWFFLFSFRFPFGLSELHMQIRKEIAFALCWLLFSIYLLTRAFVICCKYYSTIVNFGNFFFLSFLMAFVSTLGDVTCKY